VQNIYKYFSNTEETMKMHKFYLFAILFFVLGLALAPAVPAMARGDRAPGSSTIYEIAAGNDSFTILTLALETTGLDAALDGSGQFTVFAPTDEAFLALEAANPGILDLLINDPDTLSAVLLYHVTEGRRWSNSVVNRNNPKTISTLSGGTFTVLPSAAIVDTDSLGLGSPNSQIVAVDISASNGVIHVIDQVLIP
jgi:uncharacterized surface protein with fasciclin (FAS1) repeats